ncbi:hypothetical protein HAX54_043470 [Datura stramonium]|uniref:Uncharacterized protein n=1 Tax=Datura stramonium TaxID=4076 RepID=A0ABS8W108_DATST|nr:hypothetical protein [Datura stramonium]
MSGAPRQKCLDLEKFDEHLGEIEGAVHQSLFVAEIVGNLTNSVSGWPLKPLPKFLFPSPSPYYDLPVVFDTYMNNEEEEHHAQIRNMEKLILERMEVMREKLI